MERRHELDWLRVLAVLLLVYFHSVRIFDLGDFYVKNGRLSCSVSLGTLLLTVGFASQEGTIGICSRIFSGLSAPGSG